MESIELRPILVGSYQPKNGFFHRWLTKRFGDEPGCDYAYALVELMDGTVKEVRATEIKFTDRDNAQ